MARSRNAASRAAPLEGKTLTDVANRLKTARGHLDHVIRSVEIDGYPIEVLRQLAAVRGALDKTVRTVLRYYFEHAFVDAVEAGEERAATEALMRALSFMDAPAQELAPPSR